MTESFLLYTLRRLSAKDLRALCQLVRCDAFNRREEVARLCEYAAGRLLMGMESRESLSKALSQERLFAAAFPGKAYDNRALRHAMSYLLDIARRYLALVEMESVPADRNYYLCRALRRRNLDEMFAYEWSRADSQLNSVQVPDARWHFDLYDLHQERLEALAPRERSADLDLQPLHKHLTVFYLSEMLRHACSALTHTAIGAQPYDAALLEAVLQLAENGNRLAEHPPVSVYYHLCRAFHEPENIAHFDAWKRVLTSGDAQFSAPELRGIFLLGINYCIRRMNSGQKTFIREAFELYRSGLAKNLLTENGWLSGFTYKNIIRIGTALGEHDWVRHFFEQYKTALHPSEREALYRYNLAFLYFQQQDFANAMPLLQQIELEDRLNLLDARRMLLRSYFELGEYKALDSLLTSFAAYLRRQKDLGYHQDLNLNLVRFTRRLLEIRQGDNKAMKKLREEIEATERTAEKAWLLSKCQF
ncbi:MAG: hypothetical protein DYG98_27225 [Haliscomenobacteraceae bacterium CHB4]|nr:hypothetical protein [Saprospiraceae bacterium]MCE7926747.1 hypothetical protein [Haliscomenobacteraceae bacterium CHB4]